MKLRHLLMAVGVAVFVGFIGGIWFISNGYGLEWVAALQGRSPAPMVVGGTASVPNLQLSSRAVPIGLPPGVNWTYGTTGLAPLVFRPDLMPSPGCEWEVEPRPLELGHDWHQTTAERAIVGVPLLDPRSGRLQYVLVQSLRYRDKAAVLRVVVFDPAGNRFVGQPMSQGPGESSDGSLLATRSEWTNEPPTTEPGLLSVGVERVPLDRLQAAETQAQAEAQARRISILPPPRLGEPFTFDLPTVAGGRVRSSDLRGKVVLVVVGGPDTRAAWGLSNSLRDFSPADLAVVAVSFDLNPDDAAITFDLKPEQRSLVFVPNDRAIRRLWTVGASITQLPLYLLVDRAGVLRSTQNRRDLQDRLKRLIHP